MKPAVGLVELDSIAVGFAVADLMVKKAPVTVVEASPICPGKYLILVTGDEASVAEAVDSGINYAPERVVDKTVIPNLHPGVVPAIAGVSEIGELVSLGVVEVFAVATAIRAADAAVKEAEVSLIEIRVASGLGGKCYFTLTGELPSVEAAVAAGANLAREEGMLLSRVVIPAPHRDLREIIG
jgi:microcompartment protein CcmL/EutN